jgi:hypothetical protein
MGAESVDRQQQKIAEFLKILPLTTVLAGLPEAAHGTHLNEGQMDARATTLKLAYKTARTLLSDIAKL